MKDGRLIRYCLMLALPMAALVVLGAVFLSTGVSQIVTNERERVEAEARRVVDEMRRGERLPSFVWEYGAGVVEGDRSQAGEFPPAMLWKDWEASSFRKGSAMWGLKRRHGTDEAVVWVRDGRRVYAATESISETDFATMFWVFGPLLMLSVVFVTLSAIASVYSYAKSRDDFIAAAAHDLTTPLVGMRHVIGKDDEEAANLNERMIRLVENIREFLSSGGRRRVPRKEVFSIGKAFDTAYRIFAADYAEEESGPVEVIGGKNIEVCADEDLCTQILWNLLGNDLKYAAPFGRVWVKFETGGRFAKISFADEGQGMTRKQMRRAFDRYWRAKTVLASGRGGFGIGLCMSREFARAMGGNLTVAQNEPKGCVFSLTIPLA